MPCIQPIAPLEFNMDISRSIYERKSDNRLIATAQKIALYSVIAFALILFFEGIVKNMVILTLLNVGIAILNYDCFRNRKHV